MKRTADVGPLACHLAGSGATAYTATHSRLDRSIHVSLSAWRGSLFCLFVAGDSSGSLFFGGVGSWCGAASGGSAVQGCAADSSARPEEENPGEPCKSSDESRPHHSSVKVVDKNACQAPPPPRLPPGAVSQRSGEHTRCARDQRRPSLCVVRYPLTAACQKLLGAVRIARDRLQARRTDGATSHGGGEPRIRVRRPTSSSASWACVCVRGCRYDQP